MIIQFDSTTRTIRWQWQGWRAALAILQRRPKPPEKIVDHETAARIERVREAMRESTFTLEQLRQVFIDLHWGTRR